MYFRPISSLYEKVYPRNINYMPVVKIFVCLGVFAYLTSNENPIKSTDSSMKVKTDYRQMESLPCIPS